jgi:hypothetical protein
MPVLDTARQNVVHAADPRLAQSSGPHRLFPPTLDSIHHLVDRRGPISTLANASTDMPSRHTSARALASTFRGPLPRRPAAA